MAATTPLPDHDHAALLGVLKALGVTPFELRLAKSWSPAEIRQHIEDVRMGRALLAELSAESFTRKTL